MYVHTYSELSTAAPRRKPSEPKNTHKAHVLYIPPCQKVTDEDINIQYTTPIAVKKSKKKGKEEDEE